MVSPFAGLAYHWHIFLNVLTITVLSLIVAGVLSVVSWQFREFLEANGHWKLLAIFFTLFGLATWGYVTAVQAIWPFDPYETASYAYGYDGTPWGWYAVLISTAATMICTGGIVCITGYRAYCEVRNMI